MSQAVVKIGSCTLAEWPTSPPLRSDGSVTLNMFGMDFLPLSDVHQLNFELSDLDWAGNTSQAGFSASTEPCSQAHAVTSQAQVSDGSHSSQGDSLGTALPENWGVHILTLLSKSRDQPAEDRSTASANGVDAAHQACSAQDHSQIVALPAQLPDKATKQREKNKRAQKRHRDKQKVRLLQCCQTGLNFLKTRLSSKLLVKLKPCLNAETQK